MILAVLVLIAVLQGVLVWMAVRRQIDPKIQQAMLLAFQGPPSPPMDTAVQQAILFALKESGLSADLIAPTANLLNTGKLDDVLYHASKQSGTPIRTTADLARVLTPLFRR